MVLKVLSINHRCNDTGGDRNDRKRWRIVWQAAFPLNGPSSDNEKEEKKIKYV